MANYAAYCDLTTLKAALGETGTTEDTRLRAVLEDVSTWIDDWCQRHFSVRSETRTFTAVRSEDLLVDDLLSITTLKTDSDGDWDYDYTWVTTDYHLFPFNKWPKWQLKTKSGGDYSFPYQEEGVQIVGLWGYGDGQGPTGVIDSTTDTAEELDASETAVDVVSGPALAIGQTILVESEQMYITAISTNTLTVVRGVNGTTAATHATGKDVSLYRYPGPVREAALIQAQRIYQRKTAPFGVAGGGEFGQVQVLQRLDPDVRKMLDPYRQIGVA